MKSGTTDSEARIRREAAEWLTRHDLGLTPQEQDEFLQWQAADARHSAWFKRHRGTWDRLDMIKELKPLHAPRPNADLPPHRPRKSRRMISAATLLAACVALGTMLWLTRDAGTFPSGGYEARTLEDGSIMEMNRETEIEVQFTADQRRIVLRRGEALFSVAKNPGRPFVVSARGINIRAVGTVFNVRIDPRAVDVLVTEGAVSILRPSPSLPEAESPPASPVLAGHLAKVSLLDDAAPVVVAVSADETANLLRWQPQLLDFSSVPLNNVIEELNRRNRLKLILAAPEFGNTPVVASIRSNNIEGFIATIAVPAGLRAERRGEYEIVLSRAAH